MKKRNSLFVFLIFIFLTILIFRNYFFKGQLPFSANLLVSFYAPWSLEKQVGWEHGIPHKPLGFDNLRFFYPLRKLSLEIIRNGEIPLWNPYNFSGHVLLADSQIGIFYPFNILYFFLSQINAWSLIVFLTPLLSLCFMFLFLKEIKISTLGAFFGSLVWAFCGFFSVWMEENISVSHSSLWLPFILFSFERLMKSKKWRYFYLIVLGLSFSMLAGHFQFTIYTWIIALFYVWFRFKSENYRFLMLIVFLAPFVFATLLTSIHLLPVIEAQIHSPRSFENSTCLFDIYLLPVINFITYVAPDWMGNPGTYNYFGGASFYDKILYIGLIPLIFAVGAIFSPKKNKIMSFFIYVTVVTLLLCFKNPVSTTFFKLKIPFFSTVIPSRILFLTSFSLSVLASFGFDLVKFKWAQVKRGLLKALGLVFLLLLLGWGYFIYFKLKGQEMMPILFQRVMFRNLVLPALVLVISTALFLTYSGIRRIRYWLLLLMILFSFAHQIYFLNKSLYFSEKQFLFPEHEVFSCLQENAGISRFMGIGKAKIMPNFASYYGIFSPEGLDPLYSRNYGELVESAFNQGKLKETLPLIEILLPNTLEGEGTSNRWYQNRILSLLGVRYVVTDEVEEPDGSFTLFWENQKFRIWEYEDAFPRASLVYKYKVEKDKQKIIDDLFDPNFSIKDTVVLEEIPFLRGRSLPVQDGSLEPDQARILEYTPNRVVLDVDARRDGLVYLSDNYYPGWNVYVDGDKTKLYKANYSFRAVVVPAGNHQVKFSYQPTSFIFGTTLSILSLVLLVPFSLLMRKYV